MGNALISEKYMYICSRFKIKDREMEMGKEATITMEALGIGYTTRHGKKVVAEGIRAQLWRGELTCLIGANGVGKSTLLRTLSAFQPPLSGEIHLLGKPLLAYSHKELAALVSMVLTGKSTADHLTVRELVGMGRSPYTGFFGTLSAADRHMVDEALSWVGIAPLAPRHLHTLSDGEYQKAMIARALAQDTPIILLDEPTAFLDYPSKVDTLQMLRRLAHDLHKSIFLSTHDLELALQVSDRLWVMGTETQLVVGTPRELADDGTLSRFLDRKGIEFDKESLTIRVKNQ